VHEFFDDIQESKTNKKEIVIAPQEGPQEKFVASDADIVIYGGQAGGGKTFGLLFIPIAYLDVPKFDAIIFRRTTKQIKNPGGLWQKAEELYKYFPNAEKRISDLQYRFWSTGKGKKEVVSTITFAHMELEKDKENYQGAEVAFIGFDELTHFLRSQFTYMLSRNRSMSGVPGMIRATCNPDPDSFVYDLVKWWIDEEGFAIPERSGKKRYMIVFKSDWHQYDSIPELLEDWEGTIKREAEEEGRTLQEQLKIRVKTITFIHAAVEDNKILMRANPEYLSNLNSLDHIDYMRLRRGNWKVRSAAGSYFKPEWFSFVDAAPVAKIKTVRYWDRAASAETKDNPDPDFTVGIKMSKGKDGFLYIEDMVRFRQNPGKVKAAIKNTATLDGVDTFIYLEQEPGASGKAEVQFLIQELAGYVAYPDRKITKTEQMCRPVSAQAEAGNIKIVKGSWNHDFLAEVFNFPEAAHDDIVVSLIGAFNAINNPKRAGAW
jgi:predicted phage terminase large subunit-like protein